eukprot:4394292-Lingulodinium_polyedra.AAC.1
MSTGLTPLLQAGCSLFDYASRKQKRVRRATFAVELFVAVDIGDVLLFSGALYGFQHGVQTTESTRVLREQAGYSFPSRVIVDVESVFSALAASPIKNPS